MVKKLIVACLAILATAHMAFGQVSESDKDSDAWKAAFHARYVSTKGPSYGLFGDTWYKFGAGSRMTARQIGLYTFWRCAVPTVYSLQNPIDAKVLKEVQILSRGDAGYDDVSAQYYEYCWSLDSWLGDRDE